jgi:hypothetical protein
MNLEELDKAQNQETTNYQDIILDNDQPLDYKDSLEYYEKVRKFTPIFTKEDIESNWDLYQSSYEEKVYFSINSFGWHLNKFPSKEEMLCLISLTLSNRCYIYQEYLNNGSILYLTKKLLVANFDIYSDMFISKAKLPDGTILESFPFGSNVIRNKEWLFNQIVIAEKALKEKNTKHKQDYWYDDDPKINAICIANKKETNKNRMLYHDKVSLYNNIMDGILKNTVNNDITISLKNKSCFSGIIDFSNSNNVCISFLSYEPYTGQLNSTNININEIAFISIQKERVMTKGNK